VLDGCAFLQVTAASSSLGSTCSGRHGVDGAVSRPCRSDGAGPDFTSVFDGSLLLPDGRIAVGDVEQLTRLVHRVGDRGEFAVRVTVDSPGENAGAVDVMIARRSG
jgi:hypothetical protein